MIAKRRLDPAARPQRRNWLLPGAGLALAGVSAALVVPGPAHSQAAAAKTRKPNLVFIMADDMGTGDIGPYGQTKIHTPNIDRIAREGVRFTDFYAGAPVCAPSRCTLITGLHSGHSFVRDNRELEIEGQIPLPEGTPTVASLLKKQGYTTGMFGKWGLGYTGSSGEPNRVGWDTFFGYICQREAHSYYPDHLWRNTEKVPLAGNEGGTTTGKQYSHDLIADEALQFVRKNRDRPFFLYVPFTTPHLSLSVPEDSLAEYRGKFPETPYPGTKGKNGYVPQSHPRAAYAAMITRMDRDVGRILDLLKQSGLDENTLVIFTSDNGPTFDVGKVEGAFFHSALSFRAGKGSVYEGGIRVPLVARWPGHIPAGSEQHHAAYFPDVMPTLLELSGAAAPAGTDGLSFAPALLGQKTQKEHAAMYWEFPTQGGQQAVRFGRYKGVRRGIASGKAKIEVYDLQTDVSETTDISAQRPELVEQVAARFKSEHTPSKEFPLPGVDPGAKAEGKGDN
jgi:arylsulfatase